MFPGHSSRNLMAQVSDDRIGSLEPVEVGMGVFRRRLEGRDQAQAHPLVERSASDEMVSAHITERASGCSIE